MSEREPKQNQQMRKRSIFASHKKCVHISIASFPDILELHCPPRNAITSIICIDVLLLLLLLFDCWYLGRSCFSLIASISVRMSVWLRWKESKYEIVGILPNRNNYSNASIKDEAYSIWKRKRFSQTVFSTHLLLHLIKSVSNHRNTNIIRLLVYDHTLNRIAHDFA